MDRIRRGLPLCFGLVLVAAPGLRAQPPRPIALEVDAREAPKKIFHARLTIPAAPGPLTLVYPKWIPGEHGPSGPIADLAGLKMSAGGREVPWNRDPEDMFAFHVEVPAGAAAIDVALDYLSPGVDEGKFSSAASATANLAVITWNTLALAPQGKNGDELMYAASVRLPAGWRYGTALPLGRETPERVEFAPVSFTTLVDSPLLTGAHFRTVTLTTEAPVHRIHIAADGDAALEASPAQIDGWKRLVAETGALFGARHYRSYSFLLTLSEHTAHFGLEHHESSDNRAAERALLDESARRNLGTLLAHEYVHSWNGKFRSPEGLVSGVSDDYQAPVDSELLWVYEGLTEYYGEVLGTRSGLRSPELEREALALFASRMSRQSGRAWRPLADTAVAAQLLYYGRPEWASWRRGVDFYPEGALVWLDADVLIRSRSGGRKSLDDFVRAFHGGAGGAPEVRTYAAEDVYAGLNAVLPWDWAGFFRERVYDVAPRAPIGGIENAGWKLASTDVPPALVAAAEEETEAYDFWDSLGIVVQGDGKDGPGLIADVVPGMAAAQAGVGPGMKLVAVDGRRYTNDRLRDALRLARGGTEPIELLVENADTFRVCKVDDHGGERYPVLVRDPSRPDLLSAIGKPLVPVSSKQ